MCPGPLDLAGAKARRQPKAILVYQPSLQQVGSVNSGYLALEVRVEKVCSL